MTRIIEWKEREVSIREIPIEGWPDGKLPKDCEPRYAIVYAGHGRTNAAGSWTVNLPAINCIPIGPAHDAQPSVVATPTGNGFLDDIPRPYILVSRITPTTITIWSFHANGERAPNVDFAWHCVVEGELE